MTASRAPAPLPPGGLRALVRYQWRMWRNGWRRDSRQRGQRIGMIVVMPLFMGLLFAGTFYFLHYSGLVELLSLGAILSDARDSARRLSLEALAISSTATFLVLSLGSLEQAFETFFEAPDLPLLLSTPVHRGAILAIKFLANMRWDTSMVLAMSLPIWLAFAVWLEAPWTFYPVLLIAWFLLVVLVSALGALLAVGLTRVISTPRLRQLVISFTMAAGLLLVIGIQGLMTGFWRGERLVDALSAQWLSRQVWLPSVWLSRALLALMLGDGAGAWPWALLLLAGAAGTLFVAYATAMRVYRTGWSQAQEAGQRAVRARARGAARATRPSSSVWALVRKDLRLFVRQPMQWYQAILGTVVVIMVLLNFMGQRRGLPSAFMLSLVMSYVGANTFAMNLALRGVAKEGHSWWLMQVAPVSDRQLLGSKWLTAYLPTAVYGLLALVGMHAALRVPWTIRLLSIPMLLAMIGSTIVADLAVGIYRSDLERATRTRNADLVAVLVSQLLSYILVAPGLFALSLTPLLERLDVQAPLSFMLIFALGTFLPLSALYAWAGWRLGLGGLSALRLSEGRPARRRLGRAAASPPAEE